MSYTGTRAVTNTHTHTQTNKQTTVTLERMYRALITMQVRRHVRQFANDRDKHGGSLCPRYYIPLIRLSVADDDLVSDPFLLVHCCHIEKLTTVLECNAGSTQARGIR